jgi:hypothetical protein
MSLSHSGTGNDGVLRVVSVNLLDGGLGPDGDSAPREQTAAALRDWQPHLVLVQEVCAPGEDQVRRNFRALANATGLEPVTLGLPRGSKRLRTGILADTCTVEVLDDGPPPGRDAPFWSEAVIKIRDTATVLTVTSVHAPATTAAGQLTEAQRLASRTAQRGGPAIAGGDWNCYTPDDNLTQDELSTLSPHLRPARMRPPAGGRLAANYDVHETLTAVGMADPVPGLPPAAAARHRLAPQGEDRPVLPVALGPGGRGDLLPPGA